VAVYARDEIMERVDFARRAHTEKRSAIAYVSKRTNYITNIHVAGNRCPS